MAMAPHGGCKLYTCSTFCLWRSPHHIMKPSEDAQKPYLSAAEGSAPCEQVYTGYFWFCVMYFFLALAVTQIMMRFPPLGQPRSNWVAWAKVSAFSASVLLMNATVKSGGLHMAGAASDAP